MKRNGCPEPSQTMAKELKAQAEGWTGDERERFRLPLGYRKQYGTPGRYSQI